MTPTPALGTTARLATIVVGAGPAGLMFTILGRLLADRAHGSAGPTLWPIRVYDKRATYARTHRLRMAPEAYRDLQRSIDDPRFDDLINFLDEEDFAPEVNVLEEHLLELLRRVGCEREIATIGNSAGEISVATLRERLRLQGIVDENTALTVVAADSVHSGIREWVRGEVRPMRHAHEQLARIRVVGEGLPYRLTPADKIRLSKVLGSIVDYRLNRNGFAEVDLFLTPDEFQIVEQLRATPRKPVPLRHELLSQLRAPLFRALVAHLESGPAPREVLVQSTFRLEHSVMPKLTFERAEVPCHAFLLGDAGISLPFQRGMSCLARCALSLAKVHIAMVSEPDADVRKCLMVSYEKEASAVVKSELAVVRNRAQVVRALREIVRVSALLPFPIQSWWLRAQDSISIGDRLSVWFFLNLIVATLALAASGAAWVRGSHWPLAAAFALQTMGGATYHAALAFDGGSHRLVRRIWEIQIAAILVAGFVVTLQARAVTLGLIWWLALGGAFVIGLYAFEQIVTRWFKRAGLTFD